MQISFKGWNRICPLFIYAVGTNMLAWSTGPSVTVATASPVLGWRRKSVIWTVKERRALSVGAWPVCLSTKWRKFFPARGDVSMRLHFPIVIFWWSLLHHSDMFWDFFSPQKHMYIVYICIRCYTLYIRVCLKSKRYISTSTQGNVCVFRVGLCTY